MLLCYDDEQAWNAAGQAVMNDAMAEAVELTHRLNDRGQYLSAAPLQPVATAKSVRIPDGPPLVTDGPFAETPEILGAYYLIDVPSLADAIAVAEHHPGGRLGTSELRPLPAR